LNDPPSSCSDLRRLWDKRYRNEGEIEEKKTKRKGNRGQGPEGEREE
jgi:hypothetical protein